MDLHMELLVNVAALIQTISDDNFADFSEQ